MTVVAGTSRSEQESSSYNVDLKVPVMQVAGAIKGGIQGKEGSSSSEGIEHHHNYIKAKGKMVVSIDRASNIIGVEFSAEEVELHTKSSAIESIQDSYNKHFSNMRFGFSIGGSAGAAPRGKHKELKNSFAFNIRMCEY